MRLIDADAFKEYLQKGIEENAGIIPKRLVDAVLDIMEGIMLDIDEQPIIDAVPVVRCKDCKWWANSAGACLRHSVIDVSWRTGTDSTDYCSFAERRDDD